MSLLHLLGLILLLCFVAPAFAQSGPPLLLRSPTISRNEIAFVYAGDLWIVNRDGGDARRLTTGTGIEIARLFT